MSVHEGINDECGFCDYKAILKYNFKTHKTSVHEEEYDHCEKRVK